ncbi:hypothetical protein NHQ30_010160 [Ciborinia camelliae]|nr:hypothetical protein NHQ30_010160 [Ciborinia camelliae]
MTPDVLDALHLMAQIAFVFLIAIPYMPPLAAAYLVEACCRDNKYKIFLQSYFVVLAQNSVQASLLGKYLFMMLADIEELLLSDRLDKLDQRQHTSTNNHTETQQSIRVRPVLTPRLGYRFDSSNQVPALGKVHTSFGAVIPIVKAFGSTLAPFMIATSRMLFAVTTPLPRSEAKPTALQLLMQAKAFAILLVMPHLTALPRTPQIDHNTSFTEHHPSTSHSTWTLVEKDIFQLPGTY